MVTGVNEGRHVGISDIPMRATSIGIDKSRSLAIEKVYDQLTIRQQASRCGTVDGLVAALGEMSRLRLSGLTDVNTRPDKMTQRAAVEPMIAVTTILSVRARRQKPT